MKIFLIRHGESEANAKGVHQGQRINVGLSKKGKEEARKIAERLKDEKIEAIYSSDLKRAMETAEEIAKFHKLKIIPDKRLREFDSGDFIKIKEDWAKWENYKKKEKERLGINGWEVKMPGGESAWNHIERTKSFLEDIKNRNYKGNIILVAHGGTNKIFFGIIGHTAIDKIYEHKQANTCLNELEFDGKNWKVHKINCTKHLN